VAVGTADDAAADFAAQPFEAGTRSDEVANVAILTLDVIELQYDQITFTAIDTRSAPEIFENEFPIPDPVPAL
jgi:hypothetical protein